MTKLLNRTHYNAKTYYNGPDSLLLETAYTSKNFNIQSSKVSQEIKDVAAAKPNKETSRKSLSVNKMPEKASLRRIDT